MMDPSMNRVLRVGTGLLLALLAVPAELAAQGAAAPRFEPALTIGSEGEGEGQFKYVEDFAFTPDGKLLATDATHAWVQVFDKTTGKFISRFGGKGTKDENLQKPEGIAVDPQGNIFVADYDTGYVKKYDKSYKWLKTFSEKGSEPGQNFKSEFISIYDGKLYLPEVGSHRVDVFDLEGKFLFLFGGEGSEPGKLNNPEAAKASSDGKIYVADLKNDRIQIFDKEGKYLSQFGTSGSEPGQLKQPAGLGFDRQGRVYVSEIGNDRISVFDKSGKYLGLIASPDRSFDNLHGLIVDPATGWVYVANSAKNRIDVFKPAGGPGS